MCMPLFTNFCVFVQRTLHFSIHSLFSPFRGLGGLAVVRLIVLVAADLPRQLRSPQQEVSLLPGTPWKI